MPSTLLGKYSVPRDDKLIETTCYSRLTEKYIIDSFHDEYWGENNLQLGSIFFGSADGIFRRIPARQTEECGWYDPRVRPWYNAASSVPKHVVLVIDLSHSMDGNSLLTAKLAAISIINTLTVLDRASIISFSSEAENILGSNDFIEGTDPSKKKLAEAIEMLEPSNGTSNLYNAFNLTFDILNKAVTSGNSTRCNIAVIVLTDGQVDDGQSEADTSKVITFVQEQTQMFAANYSARTVVFTYSAGDEVDTSLAKQIACSTGGIWKHLGDDELVDILSSLSSYYALFAMGLAESEYISWIEPYFWVLDGRWATSVGVPVFDRSVTPYQLLGVAGVGIYMDSLERIHGENSTKTLFQKWIMKSSMEACPAIEPTECQLEALRFFGGGKNTICGLCNNTGHDTSNLCPLNTSSPINLWHNIDRKCCVDFVIIWDRYMSSNLFVSAMSLQITRSDTPNVVVARTAKHYRQIHALLPNRPRVVAALLVGGVYSL